MYESIDTIQLDLLCFALYRRFLVSCDYTR
jgi:hypothetical protein